MASLQNAIPMRWPAGPLEIAGRAKAAGFTAELRQALERFGDPASLDVLKDSPVNCLVVRWAGGLPEDAEQQKSIGALIGAARKRDLAVVGWVEGAVKHDAVIASARSAGLTAVAIGDFKGKSDFPVIPWGERASAPFDSAGPALAVTGNVWPGVVAPSGGASAGPTGKPWLDSNAWYIQLARARIPSPIWAMFDPPTDRIIPAQNYVNAICDAEAAGGRWVISLDPSLQTGLAQGDARARETFQQIGNAAGFFEKHGAWKSYRSLGVAGVMSDFAGENFDMSGEILNLMARRNLQFRVLWKDKALAQSFTGLKALIYADKSQPSPELRRKMMAFAELGGLLITGPGWQVKGKPANPDFPNQFEVCAFGKGRVAVARQELADAYQIAVDAQYLLSHAHDLVKIYNSSSSGCALVAASPDGRKAVLQILSYSGGRFASPRTVWIRQKYRNARLWQIGAAGPVPLEASPSEEYFGMEYQIPSTAPGYFALEFDV